ncbi:hypothetical protein CAPTEDRAFT_198573 [Capitella teleta]|uniref:Uncharacterized protein n=1 Tax=Capitella teleta TaxID=283909 RepID=R7V595_CAPTE|nr:hypothetical protein CAPTEDRAFT_198573 [Capitella teleta]|eukprot:ELU11531.1 hypothetical protein CAPTEDRAFT_198573 [Capitella teleta]
MAQSSPDKRQRDSLEGYIHNVSPLKEGKKGQYFEMQLQSPGLKRVLCFDPANQRLCREHAEKKSAIEISNFRTIESWDILMNSGAAVHRTTVDFRYEVPFYVRCFSIIFARLVAWDLPEDTLIQESKELEFTNVRVKTFNGHLQLTLSSSSDIRPAKGEMHTTKRLLRYCRGHCSIKKDFSRDALSHSPVPLCGFGGQRCFITIEYD